MDTRWDLYIKKTFNGYSSKQSVGDNSIYVCVIEESVKFLKLELLQNDFLLNYNTILSGTLHFIKMKTHWKNCYSQSHLVDKMLNNFFWVFYLRRSHAGQYVTFGLLLLLLLSFVEKSKQHWAIKTIWTEVIQPKNSYSKVKVDLRGHLEVIAASKSQKFGNSSCILKVWHSLRYLQILHSK